MIVGRTQGDVFDTHLKHIAFAVSAEGYNNSGFAGAVSSLHWPELSLNSGNQLGEVLHHKSGEITFHALVCHDFGISGWTQTPQFVEQCLNSIEGDEEIAIVLMGSGFVGQLNGANVEAIQDAIRRSEKKCHIYTR